MITPERFEVPRGQRLAMVLMTGVMLMVSAAAAWFALHGIAGAQDPHAALIGMSMVAGFTGLTGLLIGYDARRAWHSAITLRDGGLEVELGDDTPNFFGWGQIGGLKVRSALGGISVLGQGGERLFSVDKRIPRVGRLLHAIMVNGVFPKHAPILPYRAERAVPRQVPISIALALGVGAFALLANTPAEVRQVVLMSFGAIAVVVATVALLASRLGGARTIMVDADGVTLGRAGIRRSWSTVQGAALAFVRGPKGERFPRVALQAMDGRWEPINLPGADLVELLAAINAAAPGKIIAPPDEPLGLSNRLAFTVTKRATFRLGPPKQ